MICKECNRIYNNSEKFCNECGSLLTEESLEHQIISPNNENMNSEQSKLQKSKETIGKGNKYINSKYTTVYLNIIHNAKYIYTAIGFMAVLMIFLFLNISTIYLKKQPINFNKISNYSKQDVFKDFELIFENDIVNIEIDSKTFDSILINYFNEQKLFDKKSPNITNLHYNIEKEMLYVEIDKGDEYAYTFRLKAPIVAKEGNLQFNIKSCGLGSLYIWVPKSYFKSVTGISDNLIISDVTNSPLLVLQDIKKGASSNITLSYTYNEENLVKQFNKYAENVDDMRVIAHKEDLNEVFLSFATEKNVDLNMAKKCINYFIEDSVNLEKFAFMLNPNQLEEIYNDLGDLFIQGMTKEEWLSLSENDTSQILNQYHNTFLIAFLKHLYINKDYTISNNTVLINDSPLNFKKILNENGSNSIIYDIDIIVEGTTVYAVYNVDGNTIKKTLLSRR